jgi:signal transduction histidine kinase
LTDDKSVAAISSESASRPRSVPPSVGIIAVLAGLGATVAATALPDSPAAYVLVALNWLALVAAGIHLARRSRHLTGRERVGWALVAAALLVAAAGIATAVIVEESTVQTSAYGHQDVLFIVSYALGLAGVIQLPQSRSGSALRLQTLLDGLVGGFALALVLWVAFVAPRYAELRTLTDNPVASAVGLLYPLVDLIVVIGITVVAVRRTAIRVEPRLLVLAAGMVLQVVTDLVYLDSVVRSGGAGVSAAPATLAIATVAIGCYCITAVLPDQTIELQIRNDRAPLVVQLFPYAMVIGVLVLLGATASGQLSGPLAQPQHRPVLAWGATVVAGGMLARQAIAIRENRRLIEGHRNQMIASISHELRTPLSAVLASLEMLDSPSDLLSDDELAELNRIALDQTRYMARVVEDLILLSRDGRAIKVRPSRIAVGELVAGAIGRSNVEAVEQRVASDIEVWADVERLEQAVGNFLSNARHYGGGRVALVAEPRRTDLVIEVHDDGHGVPFLYRQIIWDRFERGSHRLDSQIQGSGMGLAVVDAVAKSHGGQVGYRRSDLLGGACFWLSIPLGPLTPRRG